MKLKTKERKRAEITKICRKATEDNCDEAIEPVTAVAKILGLDLKIDGYCDLYLEVPIQILEKINDGEIKAEDIKMTIKGNVTCINDLSADELYYYLSEFGNYLRDNYYGVGAPKLIPLKQGLSSGTVNEILEQWIKENL